MIHFDHSSEPVLIASGETRLAGLLVLPPGPRGMVLSIEASAVRHRSPRGNHLVDELRRAGLATLLLELLGPDEARADQHRFDLPLLGTRLGCAADWLAAEPHTKTLPLGLFASGRDAAAALQFAACRPERVAAVVSSGGRPDLAGADALARVHAPTLLVIDEDDRSVIEHNRRAFDQLGCEKDLAVIRGARGRTELPAPSQDVAQLAARWFKGYFGGDPHPALAQTPPAQN